MSSNRKFARGRVHFALRNLVAAGVLACAPAVTALLPAIAAQEPSAIEWSIARFRADAGQVQLTVESRWGPGSDSVWSSNRPIGDLQGLSAAQLAGPEGPVRFALTRDAG